MGRLAALAALLLLAAALPAAADPPPMPHVPRVPTTAAFGRPFVKAVPPGWIRSGHLFCDSPARDACMAAGMPMIAQGDPRLLEPLKAYVRRYADARGEVVWSEPDLGIGPTAKSVDAFAADVLDNGCYIASLTTLMSTALGNMPDASSRTRRTPRNPPRPSTSSCRSSCGTSRAAPTTLPASPPSRCSTWRAAASSR